MSSSEVPSFAAQLFQAYSASLEENRLEDPSASSLPPSYDRNDEVANGGIQCSPRADPGKEDERNAGLPHRQPPASTIDLHRESGCHQVLGDTIEAWDQIGDIASEVAHSVMAKQAALVCEIGKRELALNGPNSNKRRKMGDGGRAYGMGSPTNQSSTNMSIATECEINQDHGCVVTIDDDEDGSSGENSTLTLPSTLGMIGVSSRPSTELTLAHQVERMGRVSNYIMEIERYHRLMRAEMECMAEEESALYSRKL